MARRRRERIRLGLAIVLTLLSGGAGRATQLVPLGEAQLVEQSSLIVVGRCSDVRSAWMGRRLMTVATIAVREVLAGEPRAQVTVVVPGGMDAQRPVPVAAVVAGAPQLAAREEVVLFLSVRPEEPDTYTVTGWAQGKFPILKDATGGEVVVVDRKRPSPSGTSPPDPTGTLPLARFRARILRHVGHRSPHP